MRDALQNTACARLIERDEYVDWVLSHAGPEPRHLFVYASDAEVFDYRPGRFKTEPPLAGPRSKPPSVSPEPTSPCLVMLHTARPAAFLDRIPIKIMILAAYR